MYYTADMHSDTVLSCLREGKELRRNDLHIDAERLKASGALLQCFAAFIPMDREGKEDPFGFFKKLRDTFRGEVEKNGDLLGFAERFDDIEKNRAAGKVSAMLTVEDMGAVLEGKAERLEEAYRLGARMMTFTWNFENCLGYPNSTDKTVMEKGLKKFGFEILERAEDLGMILDVSHLNDGGFRDVAEHAKKPFVASHSDCRALCPEPRCLTDEQLRTIADKGGAVGVNFYSYFLDPKGGDLATPELVIWHLKHMIDAAGEDTPGLGSDYDGIDGTVLSWGDVSGTPVLIRAMEKAGFSPRLMEKICCKNVLRVMEEALR